MNLAEAIEYVLAKRDTELRFLGVRTPLPVESIGGVRVLQYPAVLLFEQQQGERVFASRVPVLDEEMLEDAPLAFVEFVVDSVSQDFEGMFTDADED